MEQGLDIHGKLAPPGVQPLHQRLLERIAQLKQNLKKPAVQHASDSIQKLVTIFISLQAPKKLFRIDVTVALYHECNFFFLQLSVTEYTDDWRQSDGSIL